MASARKEIHVIVVSSVLPEKTSAGQILLHRHLVDRPGITFSTFGGDTPGRGFTSLLRRVLGSLGRTPLRKFAEDAWPLLGGRWLDSALPTSPPRQSVILTVAHGDAHLSALRYARKHQLPIVAVFHDYWPDFFGGHAFMRPIVERQFRKLYHEADAALCISEGMLEELGTHSGSKLLRPIPASQSPVPAPGQVGRPFNILYFGNLADYGTMLGKLLKASLETPELKIQIRGGGTKPWSDNFQKEFSQNGNILPFAPREELDEWLGTADAFLVPMLFEQTERRRMKTSFPSKLAEFAQFGKPIIIWGPPTCTAVRWAQQEDRALCLTDPDPEAALASILELTKSTSDIARLVKAAKAAAEQEFSPDAIQESFETTLRSLVNVGQQ